jgi:uncharacterized protein YecT (DUF1311 family)
MTSDPGFEPLGRATYHGYSAPSAFPAASGAHHRPIRGAVVGGGIAIALALGLAVGFLAKPDLDVAPAKPMAPAPPGAQQGLTIEPGAPQALATVQPATGKLQVLPPDMAARAAPVPASARAASAPPAVRDVSDIAADPPSQPPAHLAPPSMTQSGPRTPYLGPAYPRLAAANGPCAGAASRAAEMVCSDPDLGAADRELTRAYRRALRSGAAPPEQLRADQQDWLAIREDAARRSPRSLARVYDQRIDELNALADDGPG